jgi:hypothetical protein
LAEAHNPCPDGSTFLVFSDDKGQSWSKPAPVCVEPVKRFSEPDIVEAAPGELVCILRQSGEHRLYVCQSSDAGETWSKPAVTSIDGLPGHVIKLSDGRLLCSYGRRKAPFGIRMSLSEDSGRTWMTEQEIVVREDLPNGDLGYPTTIEYEPGCLFVCYYCQDPDGITCVQGTYVDLK